MLYKFRRKIIKKFNNIPLIKAVNEKRNRSTFHSKARKNPPVFIYQMGKVASSSIYGSLQTQYNGVSLHAHSFSKNHVKPSVRFLYEINEKEHIPIKVISLIREPIGRNISAFYENFKRDLGFKFEENPYKTAELQALFLENHDHMVPLLWFDHNILKNFNIDVFEQPFPDEGYATYHHNNIDLLLLKHNLDDTIKETIVGEFLDVPNFSLINYNVGLSKIYADSYKEFLQLPLPEVYITKMLNSKYVKHFYAAEIDAITNKWRKSNSDH